MEIQAEPLSTNPLIAVFVRNGSGPLLGDAPATTGQVNLVIFSSNGGMCVESSPPWDALTG
jgi:hypothetical protein